MLASRRPGRALKARGRNASSSFVSLAVLEAPCSLHLRSRNLATSRCLPPPASHASPLLLAPRIRRPPPICPAPTRLPILPERSPKPTHHLARLSNLFGHHLERRKRLGALKDLDRLSGKVDNKLVRYVPSTQTQTRFVSALSIGVFTLCLCLSHPEQLPGGETAQGRATATTSSFSVELAPPRLPPPSLRPSRFIRRCLELTRQDLP